MKIITLNTHSLIEENYETKLIQFVEMVKTEQPDVIALQEVNQSLACPAADSPESVGYISSKGNDKLVRQGNHVLRLATLLKEAGTDYWWTWIPLKIGYGIYEEGLAIMSRQPIEDTHQFYISKIRDYENWKSRKALGIRVNGIWYYTIHMGWWDDEEEPFAAQWDLVMENLSDDKLTGTCFIMGDFNSPSAIRGEGYDYVKQSGWYDTYILADNKDEGITVGHVIDGWRERMDTQDAGMRIDYIWCNHPLHILESEIILNGMNYPIVSDHYGVQIMINKI